MTADEFNALYEVGTPVFAYPGARPEDIPSARRIVTRTRTKAQSVGLDRDGVVWVEDHGAYIALTHVDVVTEAEFKDARLAETVAHEGALPVPAGDASNPMMVRFLQSRMRAIPLSDERLVEIKSLLRYEISISFHSARAKESMLLLVAEVERLRVEVDKVQRSYTFDTAELKRERDQHQTAAEVAEARLRKIEHGCETPESHLYGCPCETQEAVS